MYTGTIHKRTVCAWWKQYQSCQCVHIRFRKTVVVDAKDLWRQRCQLLYSNFGTCIASRKGDTARLMMFLAQDHESVTKAPSHRRSCQADTMNSSSTLTLYAYSNGSIDALVFPDSSPAGSGDTIAWMNGAANNNPAFSATDYQPVLGVCRKSIALWLA